MMHGVRSKLARVTRSHHASQSFKESTGVLSLPFAKSSSGSSSSGRLNRGREQLNQQKKMCM